jgi:hypothetical protein
MKRPSDIIRMESCDENWLFPGLMCKFVEYFFRVFTEAMLMNVYSVVGGYQLLAFTFRVDREDGCSIFRRNVGIHLIRLQPRRPLSEDVYI